MAPRTDDLDLARLGLKPGEGRRLDLAVRLDPILLGGETYVVEPRDLDVRLDLSRTATGGWALRLRFDAGLQGPCMRCMHTAEPTYGVDVREVNQPGAGEELESPYVQDETLDLAGWAREALVLMLPSQLNCQKPGTCPHWNEFAPPEPAPDAEREPDPRWAKLSELKFD